MRTAVDILALIQAKHAEDICVPECKDGPSQMGPHLRLDCWTMRRSWSEPNMTGYEIKISRSDYQRGRPTLKAYLPLCQRLYVVCPWKMLEPDELPDDVGLMHVSKTGSKLITRKRAPKRVIAPPETLLRYILITRTAIRPAMWSGTGTAHHEVADPVDVCCPRCGCRSIEQGTRSQNMGDPGPDLNMHGDRSPLYIKITEYNCRACSRRWA